MADPFGNHPHGQDAGSSALSHSNSTATADSFSRGLFRSASRKSGYQRMPESGHELSDIDDGAVPSLNFDSSMGDRGFGLSVIRNSSPHIPIKTSPPDTPHSYSALIDHVSNDTPVSEASPHMTQPPHSSSHLSPDIARISSISSPQDTANWTPSMPTAARATEPDRNDSSTRVKTAPVITQTSPGLSSIGEVDRLAPRGEMPDDDDEFDDDTFYRKFQEPPSQCWSKHDIHQKRTNWISITIYVLSIYSTILSGIWLVTAILQPRWGKQISSKHGLLPSTATTIAALLAKTIEMSFVTVFITFIGQVLTRRSFIRSAKGMSLAEMTMRNWVIQPGSLITHFETVVSSGLTLLGVLSLTASFAAAFYTTASDAMVAPKLKFGKWEHRELSGYVRASYASADFAAQSCPYMFSIEQDKFATESCMNVELSGLSYRNLLNFMQMWTNINHNGTIVPNDMTKRPYGTMLLYDNTTMYSQWIETTHGNVTAHFNETGRLINNVTLAMPHPGVYAASTNPINGILQPDDLSGVGEYAVRAGVVAPAVNVLCVNMDEDELKPLVYTEWPNAWVNETGVSNQVRGWDGWEGDVPQAVDDDGNPNWLNRTKLDDIFQWGPKYKRRPPVWQMYPFDFNLLANATVTDSDSIYTLGKMANFNNYTMCQLRSWTSPNCSTVFNISGTAGATMRAHCEDPNDANSYLRSFDTDQQWGGASLDWRWLADQWRLSMDLNGGVLNVNASNARILTQLALKEPTLPTSLPSLAEALAIYASSLVVLSAIDTPFRHYWDYDDPDNIVTGGPGHVQAFNATLITQQFTSGHIDAWQSIFYVVLVIVFGINLFCSFYFIIRNGLVTDFTEPQNLFALAVNSPPSQQLNGSCGAGPEKKHLEVPWRVAYAHSANHYFFEEANGGAPSGRFATETTCSGFQPSDARNSSYKRLSESRGWL